ncbi:translation initiation factor eIF-2B subunit epsilon [Ischnura elegans]|uniref:translation initiation factor eIF-2B subunit epsilon n=1 Tax=Ischnura elegans TaxID=197161 RepID=UPI001ED8961D|nr:translation initiation factor eIF-2B subunit epsilon [Ischnura elegans]XP_046394085.1 translation initiation factor eIF-2B subunit epsilon [Ischnura elegans]
MSSAHQKSGSKAKQNIQKEDVVQAVVIADSFNSRFAPLTNAVPRALLNLINVPLLDYTLECLGNSGVQEVILFCCNHADQIKKHIMNSKWKEKSSPMSINIIVSEDCRSLGDAMRDIDAKALIRGDFILLHGDLVSNVQIIPILEWHRKIQKQDKGAVMTVVYSQASPGHRLRSPDEEVVVAVDGKTNQILFHQRVGGIKKISLPLEILLSSDRVNVWHDILDPGIAICSPAVPPLFSDNFDFQSVDDLVKDLLINEEVLTSTLYCHRLRGEFAARVSSPRFYHAISLDVIHRWVFPLVPDCSIGQHMEPYMYLRHNVYKQKNVTLSKKCTLEEDVVLASGTSVGEGSVLSRCSIGHNCRIGSGVHLSDCFIMDNVEIQDGCEVRFSIIANDVVLKESVCLKGNCLIGSGVVVEAKKVLRDSNLVSSAFLSGKKNGFGDSKDQELEQLGPKAFVYRPLEDSESEDEGEMEGVGVKDWSRFHKLEVPPEEDDESEEESEDDSSDEEGMGNGPSPVPDDTSIFFSEVLDSLVRGFDEKLKCENLILEINSSRYAYNVTVKEVNLLVVKSIMSIPHAKTEKQGDLSTPKGQLSGQQLFQQLKPIVQHFLPILKNYIRNKEAQFDCLQAIEEHAVDTAEFGEIVVKILHMLYDQDVLAEETIIKWHQSSVSEAREEAKHLHTKLTPFIRWLQEADEESEEESEEESGSD